MNLNFPEDMVKLTESEVWYLDGLLSLFEDLPDGAWEAACVSMIESCEAFDNKEPHDVWLSWCFANSKENTGS